MQQWSTAQNSLFSCIWSIHFQQYVVAGALMHGEHRRVLWLPCWLKCSLSPQWLVGQHPAAKNFKNSKHSYDFNLTAKGWGLSNVRIPCGSQPLALRDWWCIIPELYVSIRRKWIAAFHIFNSDSKLLMSLPLQNLPMYFASLSQDHTDFILVF